MEVPAPKPLIVIHEPATPPETMITPIPEPEAPSPPPPDATLSDLPVTDPVSETNPEPPSAEEVVDQN